MKTLIAALIVILALLQYKLWFAKGGVPELVHLRHKVEMQIAKNIQLEERNAALEAEVRDLKHGDKAIEARARDELGMIKRGEVFYQIVKKQKKNFKSL